MARTLLRSTLLGAALATFAVAPASAAEVFKVAARISQGGELVAEPVMLVNAQAPAKVRMTDEAPYEFSVHLAPVDGADAVVVEFQLSTDRGHLASTVTTQPGAPITVSTGDIGLELTVARHDG